MSDSDSKLERVLSEIDHCNAQDPNRETEGEQDHPKEWLYGHRMSRWLNRLYPDADAAVQIAVRAQHIERWKRPRQDYPMDRQGYRQWRSDCAAFHADRAGELMKQVGYDATTIERVRQTVRKQNIKGNPDSQALEDCAALVFLEHYFDRFIDDHPDYDDDKMLKILRRTWSKMSETGQQAALAMPHSEKAQYWLNKALA